MTAGPTSRPGRLDVLDGLRGVAALLVVLQHGGERVSAGFRDLTGSTVQLGQLGVMTFFLVSGFVVPLSMDRLPPGREGLRRFVVTRTARLYPAYWVSLLLTLLAWRADAVQVPPALRHGPGAWLADTTMLQSFLGAGQAQGQYWSLAFELLFYALVGLLFALGLHRRTVPLALGALVVALATHAAARATGHTVALGLANVATMFVGTVLYRVHTGALAARTGWWVYALGAAAVQLVLVLRLRGHTDSSTGGTLGLGPMVGAWAGAYALVAAAFLLRRRRVPRWLIGTGVVSYSVYLLHPLVIGAVGRIGGPATSIAVWAGLSLAAGWASYRLVEAPGMRAGRRAVSALGRRERRRRQEVAPGRVL